jgi:hypothetical protein
MARKSQTQTSSNVSCFVGVLTNFVFIGSTLFPAPGDCNVLCLLLRQSTGYGLDDRGVGVRVPAGSRIFSSPRRSERL